MTDLFKAMLKAGKLVRKRRPISAALALQAALAPPKKRSLSKPSTKPKTRVVKKQSAVRAVRPAPGTFISDKYACVHGTLAYRLYTPMGSNRRRMPLVVMLHGCSQSAADFAAGTDMNSLADEMGFLVLYPQQPQTANLARCWNWHSPNNQVRGRGEPAMIAALTRHALSMSRANPSRVYVAGISAGGAAAAIIGASYPDLFVAVGVHSGVAQGNIRSLGSAIAAMRGKANNNSNGKLPRQLPTIVFHGDEDRVVHPSNANGFLKNLERSRKGPLYASTRTGCSDQGRHYTQRVYGAPGGEVLLEDWTVHGSGHAWSGGNAAGSHTDPRGPSASREMIRFFLARKRPARVFDKLP